ncbi:MAG: HDOD domain-containing protein [Melioribacteraceae bacterium]|nr:HDOD domain-containing protein [Melioribacteraceae bacterium]
MNNFTSENSVKQKEKVERKLSNVYNLPSLPLIILEVGRLIEDPKTNASQLGKVISKDQGLVTKILTVANSPLYGIPRKVSTIDFAIVILGFSHIKNIVVALTMMDTLKTSGTEKFSQRKFWLHSLMTATAAKKIADDLGFSATGEIFTMGLLHDLGIPVIYKYFPKEYAEIVKAVKNDGLTYAEAENDVLGINHQEIGAYLLEQWNLPSNLSKVVEMHHNPSSEQNFSKFVSLTHLADYMTNKLKTGEFEWDKDLAIDNRIIDTLNMGDTEYLENFIMSYEQIFKSQIESLNI